MSDTLRIRAARPEDRSALIAMIREVVEAGDAVAYDTVEGLLGYWDDPLGKVFVVEEGGEVLGTYIVKPNQPGHGDHVANAGYIVASGARGRGLAHRMGEHSLKVAGEQGYTAMQFNYVVASNEAAVRAWRRLGFDIVGRVPAAFRHAQRGLTEVLIFHRTLEGTTGITDRTGTREGDEP